ncbi:MAG: DNA adenine methylase [Planctomycetaceae bacterium]|jgi:adenine-specific DNA-methyltransferase|nr:DNA adenine methylase [Planctomycetaceae bacterium]
MRYYESRFFPSYQENICQKPVPLESRRYIGNKAKLTRWIMELIDDNTKNVKTFTDIFAGTASVSNQALRKYKRVIINDTLRSNNVIYRGFFSAGYWNKEKLNEIIASYNSLNANFVSKNYGIA